MCRYAVLTFDLYDRGGSKLDDPSHELHSADLFVDQVRELWAKVVVQNDAETKKDNHASRDYTPPPLRTDGFTLVGHSMGGAVSLLVAHRYPDLVRVRRVRCVRCT
jgi:pimeloyl-ACP methyl ester carboxylesterase